MGMSASQARLIQLEARQSNLEYQGQQINQERTILSQQCTALYNSLLAMTVPTPPSTQDFTTVEYVGTDGATKYTFNASSVKPGKNGNYCVTIGTKEYGKSLAKNNGYVTTSNGEETIRGSVVQSDDFGEFEQVEKLIGYEEGTAEYTSGPYMKAMTKDDALKSNGELYLYDEGSKNFTKVTKEDIEKLGSDATIYVKTEGDDSSFNAETDKTIGAEINTTVNGNFKEYEITKDQIKDFYVITNGNISAATEDDFEKVGGTTPQKYKLKNNVNYLYKDGKGDTKYTFKNEKGVLVGGKTPYTLKDALNQNLITQTDYDGYVTAINNANIKWGSSDDTACGPDAFYLYFDDNGKIHFTLINDVTDNSGAAITYDFIANGEYTKEREYDDTKLEFDPASGRITSMTYPTSYDADNNPLTWTTISVSAQTKTDEAAYKDAYAQYEYEQYLYDKKQQEINAKTEVIQQEDRNLELKLQRLDNERQQITTEIEAVQKVIDDNIEASYKTFSG